MKKVIFIYLSCFCLITKGQSNLDSLWAIWSDPNNPDTIRAEAINSFAWDGYLFTQPDSAFHFAQLEYDFAKEMGLKKYMASALKTQGVSKYFKGDYGRAVSYYDRCLKTYEEIEDMSGIASTLNNIGLVYNNQGNYAKAIDYYSRSLSTYEKMADKKGIAIALNNIGLINYYLKNYEASIDYHSRSLKIREELNDHKGIAASLNNLGIVYEDQGVYDKAIEYFTNSLAIKENIGDKRGLASSLNNIGLCYEKVENNVMALEYHNRSLKIRQEISDKMGIASSLINIGNVYSSEDDFPSAISYHTWALKIAKEVGSAIEIKRAADALYSAYKTSGNYKSALEMHELFIATKDSISSEENQKEVIRQQYEHAYERKVVADSVTYVEKQKVQQILLEKSKTQRIALIIGLILLLVFSGIMYNRFLITRKQQLVIAKQNNELNEFSKTVSHDLKAPLGAIQALAQLSKDYAAEGNYKEVGVMLDLASDSAQKMSHFIDELLEYSRSGLKGADVRKVDVELLIYTISDSLAIPDTVWLGFEHPMPSLKISETQISQVFQNLISNAVKYSEKDRARINIGFEKTEDELKFYVKDNGPGIDESYFDKIFEEFEIIPGGKRDQTGIGLAIAKKIVENHGGKIWVESKLGVGSTFYFTLSREYYIPSV